MKLPETPEGWAIHLSGLLKAVQNVHGTPRFPVDLAAIAQDYSRQVFPDEPITVVRGEPMFDKFEGMLAPNPNVKGEWGIFFNSAIESKGRRNFTLAHELGHYLLHRQKFPRGLQCTGRDMIEWKSEAAQIEAQANTFSSYLLMPLDDFRQQLGAQKMTMELIRHLSDRYDVSITAAILKWLSMTQDRAMVVVSKDGFIDWSWSSERLLKSGVYYKGRQEVIELPSASLAARQDAALDNLKGLLHPPGVWKGQEEVHEMVLFSQKNLMTISLLIYPYDPPYQNYDIDEGQELMDTFEKFPSFGGRRY